MISGRVIWPLRVFMGVTFVYAGLQKLADPGFLAPGSGTYIGKQMLGFSQGSPIAFLFHWFALPFPVLIGSLTIAAELGIGIMILLGLLTRPAALIGLGLNLVFFLSATWRVYPYFYGSDIVFVMCWLTLAVAGPGPRSLDAWRFSRASPAVSSPPGVRSQPAFSRREALVAGLGTLSVLVLALVPRGRATGQLVQKARQSSLASRSGNGALQRSGEVRVGSIRALPANDALAVTDPKTGDPAVVVHVSDSQYYAYDAVCTHAGCTVQYDPQQQLLMCPCHGGAFDPAHGAQVVAGPPPSPLAPLEMKIDAQGNIYLFGVPGQQPHSPKPAQSSDDGNSSND